VSVEQVGVVHHREMVAIRDDDCLVVREGGVMAILKAERAVPAPPADRS
jgi:hypothetical protein